MAQQAGAGQRFVEIAEAVEAVIPDVVGKDLRLNVSAAIPAVLLGVGFPVNALKGVPMLARTAGPDRAPERGADRPDRLRAVVPGDARIRVHRRGAGRLLAGGHT